MEQLLNNPAYNALISGNHHLALGNEDVKYFDKDISPFVGLKENSEENFKILYELVTDTNPRLFVATVELDIPAPWKISHCIKGFQMVCNAYAGQTDFEAKMIPLTEEHVPQMLALTKLTNPGPFGQRTIDFGHYMGIFEGSQLAAMAGQRLYPAPYAEVSAVCTHPDHNGKGYARQLLKYQINRIKAAQNIPFLHVKYDNERAIKLYESLGFLSRKEVFFYVIGK
jgi:predicted GNAT family acetyltransferase